MPIEKPAATENTGSVDLPTFEEMFREHYVYLCNLANKILNDRDEAEEIVQNVFVNVWNRQEYANISTSVKGYLSQAVKNACMNFFKHDKVKQKHVQYEMYYGSKFSADDPVVAGELNDRIDRAIQGLPEQRRRVFLMSRHEGLKYKEIAEQLSISPKTVENHMGKALEHMRKELIEYLSILLVIWLENFIR
ncbi:MAG: RNA polymerase sigma-70 factor [Cyclobacteriaceae bacterium]|nr:RNA polymerase sigma-70 factor [Cyclobacteriaceae bacterium]